MFTAEDIQARIKKPPFVPVRIITSAGDQYDVYHPDQVLVSRRFLVVGTASADNPTISDRVTQLSILHIAAMENLPTSTPKSGSGAEPAG